MTTITGLCLFLTILPFVLSETTISGPSVTCYSTENECLSECNQVCYEVDVCNNKRVGYSHTKQWACSPNIALIIGLVFGILAVIIIVSCICCFCCSFCIIAKCLRRRKANYPGQVVSYQQQPEQQPYYPPVYHGHSGGPGTEQLYPNPKY